MIDDVVSAAEAGERFDRALARRLGASVHGARRLIEAGKATLDGKPAKPGATLREGQRLVSSAAPTADDHAPVAQPELPLAIVATTEAFLIVDKAAGQPCHPLRPGERGTLANALVARHPEVIAAGEFPREAGLVNRLDNDTSGLVLVARDRAAWLALRAQSRDGEMTKTYLAIVEGVPLPVGEAWHTIDRPLRHSGQRMRVADDGQPATTRWRARATSEHASLLEVELRVGRHHQIRAHLEHLGHPLIGDALYGGKLTGSAPGHQLHSWKLTVKNLDYIAPPPAAFTATLRQYSLDGGQARLE